MFFPVCESCHERATCEECESEHLFYLRFDLGVEEKIFPLNQVKNVFSERKFPPEKNENNVDFFFFFMIKFYILCV